MNDGELRRILGTSPRVAVLGIHEVPEKAAFFVPQYLHEAGYQIFGVNPKLAGRSMFDHPVVATLSDLPGPVDMIDVFRQSKALPGHLEEILAMEPRPAVVWLQLGIHDDSFTERLREAGIEVVEGRCALAEHRRLGLGSPS